MSAEEWTVEQLEALPANTVIEWLDSGVELTAVKQEKGRWHLVHRTYYEYPEGIIEDADPGSIRVVSVPIDALLADETVQAMALTHYYPGPRKPDAPDEWEIYNMSVVARAAVTHITGEATK